MFYNVLLIYVFSKNENTREKHRRDEAMPVLTTRGGCHHNANEFVKNKPVVVYGLIV